MVDDMNEPLLEDVFKISGIPTYTFVRPSHYDRLKVAVRTQGRGVVVEGPSGIGKSTAVANVLRDLDLANDVLDLSARSPSDVGLIAELPSTRQFGVAIVDDFHRLPPALQAELADLLKRLADTDDASSKLIVIGINQAGSPLIKHAPDLANRVDRIKFEAEPDSALMQMIQQGTEVLNIEIEATESIVSASHGSFYLAQLLCHEACLQGSVLHRQAARSSVTTLYASVRRQVMERQKARFGDTFRSFARGNKFRPGGRAPYFHMLSWLAASPDGTIDLSEEMRRHPTERVSVKATIDNKGIDSLVGDPGIAQVFYYNPHVKMLAVEDPHAIFYLRNLDLTEFIREVGFTKVSYDKPYDVALSFTGEDREFAQRLYDHLIEEGLAVFYDKAEESRILAEDVEALLGPIYESDSEYVTAVMGSKYGVKRWTLYEASRFKERIEKGEVIPIWSKEVPQSAFDPTYGRGGLSYDPHGDLAAQASACAAVIASKFRDR